MYKLGLTPNQLYLLVCKKKGKEAKLINIFQETRALQVDGFLTDEPNNPEHQPTLTPKAEESLVRAVQLSKTAKEKYVLTKEEHQYVSKYRELFPAGKISGRPPFRASVKELIPRFEHFFARYPEYHDWNLVLQATAMHIHDNEADPKFINGSENFIYKTDRVKGEISNLSKLCQAILDGHQTSIDESEDNSYINIPGLNR
jgi:hypothetical protein